MGVPVHDDRKLFEMLILEGVQASLSWSLILKKRAGYLQAQEVQLPLNKLQCLKDACYGPYRYHHLWLNR